MKTKDSKQPKEPTVVEHKQIARLLPVPITDPDRLRFGMEMADAKDGIDRLQAQASEVSKDFKAKIAAHETRMGSLSSILRAGYQYVDVACEVRLNDPCPNLKSIYRLDTMEFVEKVEMTDTDRQSLLPFPALEPVE